MVRKSKYKTGGLGASCTVERVYTVKKDGIPQLDINKLKAQLKELSRITEINSENLFRACGIIKNIIRSKKGTLEALCRNVDNANSYYINTLAYFQEFFTSAPNKQYLLDHALDKIQTIIENTQILLNTIGLEDNIQFKKVQYDSNEMEIILQYDPNVKARALKRVEDANRRQKIETNQIKKYASGVYDLQGGVNESYLTELRNNRSKSLGSLYRSISYITELNAENKQIIKQAFRGRFSDTLSKIDEYELHEFENMLLTLFRMLRDGIYDNEILYDMDRIIRQIYWCYKDQPGVLKGITLYTKSDDFVSVHNALPNDILHAFEAYVIMTVFISNMSSRNSLELGWYAGLRDCIVEITNIFARFLHAHIECDIDGEEHSETWWVPFIYQDKVLDYNKDLPDILHELISISDNPEWIKVSAEKAKEKERKLTGKLNIFGAEPSKEYIETKESILSHRELEQKRREKEEAIRKAREEARQAELKVKTDELLRQKQKHIREIQNIWNNAVADNINNLEQVEITRLWYLATTNPKIGYDRALEAALNAELYCSYVS